MRTINVRRNRIELFDSISELTADRDHAINKLVVMDLNIGSDMPSVAKHLSKLFAYLADGKNAEAQQEAKNLHNNYFMMIEGINPRSLSFAVFVKSINRKLRYVVTSEEAKNTADELFRMGIKADQVEEQLTSLKKKLMSNFEPSFLIDLETEEMPI